MLDTTNIETEVYDLPIVAKNLDCKPFDWMGHTFLPLYSNNGIIKGYRASLKNLNLSLYGTKLIINNSWHKYYHGNNYSDYLSTEVKETYLNLNNDVLNLLENSKVKKLAYGCNINLPVYEGWEYLRSKPVENMKKKSFIYGKSFDFSDYKIKGYDKSYEVNKQTGVVLPNQLYRFEKEVKYIRHLQKKGVPILTTTDLFNHNVLELLAKDLLQTYSLIEKSISTLNMEPTLQEIYALATMSNKAARELLKTKHNKTYKRLKKVHQNSFNELKSNSIYSDIENELKIKLTNLINH